MAPYHRAVFKLSNIFFVSLTHSYPFHQCEMLAHYNCGEYCCYGYLQYI